MVISIGMSEQTHGVGTTLPGEDIAVLLLLLETDNARSPSDLLSTEATAVPLSIFGSLSIVKAGISALISRISISKRSV
jgi:hypothetical protein